MLKVHFILPLLTTARVCARQFFDKELGLSNYLVERLRCLTYDVFPQKEIHFAFLSQFRHPPSMSRYRAMRNAVSAGTRHKDAPMLITPGGIRPSAVK